MKAPDFGHVEKKNKNKGRDRRTKMGIRARTLNQGKEERSLKMKLAKEESMFGERESILNDGKEQDTNGIRDRTIREKTRGEENFKY